MITQVRHYLPPYIAFRTFVNLLEELADHGVPKSLDRQSLRRYVSQGVAGQVLSALRFLQLVEHNGTTKPELSDVVDRNSRQSALRNQLRIAYGYAFDSLSNENADFALADKVFLEALGATSETTRHNAIRFFSQALTYVGIKNNLLDSRVGTEDFSGDPTSSGNDSFSARPIDDEQFERRGARSWQNVTRHQSESIELQSGGRVTLVVDANLLTLDRRDREFVFSVVDKFQEYAANEGVEGKKRST
jgi:hypothetical protein